MIKVAAVHPGTIAEELGLQAGSALLAVNGRELHDFLDWEFLTAEEQFLLHVRQPGGEEIEFDIERPLGESIGVDLEPPRVRRCANRCDFCFVDGLPEGLRESLYIRDDDYRLSFRYGHFVTLTNLKPWDIERIIEYRLSPLYVSVHATEPVLRRYVLRNPLAPDILPLMRRLADHGIRFHTQVVMSPGVNDGPVLEQTLRDLYEFGDAVGGCSVVPVGLTEFSKHHLVRELSVEECRAAIRLIDAWSAVARRERGITWAFGADELYLRAELELPPPEIYDDFDQIENGVGAVRFLQQRIEQNADALERLERRRIGVVTGTAMGRLMSMVLEPLARITGAEFEVIAVENTLFGASVTSAGLLPGAAIQAALAERRDLDLALFPGEALNDDQLFMDNMSHQQLRDGVPVEVRPSKDFLDALALPAAA